MVFDMPNEKTDTPWMTCHTLLADYKRHAFTSDPRVRPQRRARLYGKLSLDRFTLAAAVLRDPDKRMSGVKPV